MSEEKEVTYLEESEVEENHLASKLILNGFDAEAEEIFDFRGDKSYDLWKRGIEKASTYFPNKLIVYKYKGKKGQFKIYFRNGKHKIISPILTYPKFNEEDLK